MPPCCLMSTCYTLACMLIARYPIALSSLVVAGNRVTGKQLLRDQNTWQHQLTQKARLSKVTRCCISLMTSPIPSRQGSFTSPPPPASPRRPSGLGLGSNAEQRKARREQFRSFYGLKNETVEEQGLERGEGSKTGDPLDLSESKSEWWARSGADE